MGPASGPAKPTRSYLRLCGSAKLAALGSPTVAEGPGSAVGPSRTSERPGGELSCGSPPNSAPVSRACIRPTSGWVEAIILARWFMNVRMAVSVALRMASTSICSFVVTAGVEVGVAPDSPRAIATSVTPAAMTSAEVVV